MSRSRGADAAGLDISHETGRAWWDRFGPMFEAKFRKKRVAARRNWSPWRRHLDEVFAWINDERHDLWRAVEITKSMAGPYRPVKLVTVMDPSGDAALRVNLVSLQVGFWANSQSKPIKRA